MWRQSLAEKKGVSPSEALSPDRTLSVAPCASSLSMFSFRLGDVSAVDGKASSGDEARFFRREVRDEAGDLRYVTIRFKGMRGLTNSPSAEVISVAIGPG